jgi:hypothetical protein
VSTDGRQVRVVADEILQRLQELPSIMSDPP